MRLNKKTKGGFVGPLCGVMALGIIGLGIGCPYLDGVHAADEKSNFPDFSGECTVAGSTQSITTDAAGNILSNGVVIGSITKNVGTDENPNMQTANMPILKDGNVQYEYPQLVCKKFDGSQFFVNVKPTRESMINDPAANEAGEFEFTIDVTKTNPFYDTAGRDAEGSMEFDVTAKELRSDYEDAKADIDFEFLANVKDFVQITKPTTGDGLGKVEIEVNPGNFASNSTDFDVLANRGYEIHVTADEVNLTGTDGNAAKITPIANNVEAANADKGFGDNTWGYSVDKVSANDTATVKTYRPITSTIGEAALTATEGTAGQDSTYRFTCGTKVGSTLPADEYSTTVVISAVIPAAAAANL